MNIDIEHIGERKMTPALSYRVATAMMTAFVVFSLWTPTLTIPADAAIAAGPAPIATAQA
ncbi:MAG: hypothetical protein R3D89_00295 [Sphingomonadaceae bacterium]